MLLPKTQPLLLPKHLARVRDMPCTATGRSPCDAHHIRMGWYAKSTPHDDRVVPLIHEEHMKLHQIGEKRYWRQLLAHDDLLLGYVMVAYAKSLQA